MKKQTSNKYTSSEKKFTAEMVKDTLKYQKFPKFKQYPNIIKEGLCPLTQLFSMRWQTY